ncbi:hypothetical protein V8F33_003777 [Rhypophila sp. PSN 637]
MDLGCKVAGRPLSIVLVRDNDRYVRTRPERWMEISDDICRVEPRTLYLVKYMDHVEAIDITDPALSMSFNYWLGESGYTLGFSEMWPPGIYDRKRRKVLMRDKDTYVGFIKFVIQEFNLYGKGPKVGELLAVCTVVGKALHMSLIHGPKAESF